MSNNKQSSVDELCNSFYEESIDESNIPREHYEYEIKQLMIEFALYYKQTYKKDMMTNDKQSSVEILESFFRRHCNPSVCDIEWNDFNTTFLEAEAMHKEEQSKFTIDYFNWLHNNQYKYNPKVKMYQKMMINETLFFTIEELMMEFNKTLGGIDEKQQGI